MHQAMTAFGLDRALAQRDLHRAKELVAVEWHAPIDGGVPVQPA